jgi:quinol monooxygenase YgiN
LKSADCTVVELRRYRLHPGARDTLIELFDREFVESQEAVGMHLLGQFRDLDDPDSFVWLRGFQDMSARKRALEAFYGGPIWKAHSSAANVTMIDSDNVLLLRPVAGLELDSADRPRSRAPRLRPDS